MGTLRRVLQMLRQNRRTLLEFEILYKTLSLAVFTPLFWTLFNGIMRLTGYAYLTRENILAFVRNPITVVALLLLLACMAAYTLIDIGAILFLLDKSHQGHRTNLAETVKFALKNARQVFHWRNLPVAAVMLFMTPFLNLGVAVSYLNTVTVPEFITEHIFANWYLLALLIVLLLGIGLLLLRWMFAFHYFTLERCSFRQAARKSARLSRGNRGRNLLALIGTQLVCYLLFFLLVAIGVLAVVVLAKAFSQVSLLQSVTAPAIWALLAVALVLLVALCAPLSYACITALFYTRKEQRGEPILHVDSDRLGEAPNMGRKFRALEALVLVAAILGCTWTAYRVADGRVNLNIEFLKTMEITAHRGASAAYPENTMSAFAGAVEQEANWIELDVQQSLDGQIFVQHDTSFKRTAGLNKNTWELTWAEISQLDAGSFFSADYAGERIPLLAEVIEFAQENHIRLNIELKPTGHETDFERSVVELIEAYDFLDDCVVTSQKYEVLENVKACNEDVTTVYVMSLAYGSVNRLAAADHFSVAASSISARLVSSVHNQGKQIYAWTVNSRDTIDRMIELHVDNIITDNVPLARERVYSNKTSSVVNEYVRYLLSLG